MIKKEYKIPTQKAIEIDGEVFMENSAEPEDPQENKTQSRNSLFNDDEDYDW